MKELFSLPGTLAALLLVSGCASMDIGSGSAKTAATGSAGGANAQGANSGLERCDKTLGTVEVIEDFNSGWYHTLSSYKLGSTAPVLKLLAQQSNCFVVVDRGRAMNSMMRERSLAESGELRGSSNFGKGQMVSADYTLSPSVTFSDSNSGGIGGSISNWFGNSSVGRTFAGVAGGASFKEASTMLTLVDNRSSVQLAAAEGSARNTDFKLMTRLFSGGTAAGLGGYSNTAEGKVVAAALTDSFNNLVKAMRNYKQQNVKGGLGTGRSGELQVQPD
ncbi:MAG: peptidoglycan-binding protein [Proteobacteria bacterium]|nr:peptidoglycan-binding protein [Pseudomonadota bacterium]